MRRTSVINSLLQTPRPRQPPSAPSALPASLSPYQPPLEKIGYLCKPLDISGETS